MATVKVQLYIFSAFRVSYPDLMTIYHQALFFLIFKARELKIIVIFHQVQKNLWPSYSLVKFEKNGTIPL